MLILHDFGLYRSVGLQFNYVGPFNSFQYGSGETCRLRRIILFSHRSPFLYCSTRNSSVSSSLSSLEYLCRQ